MIGCGAVAAAERAGRELQPSAAAHKLSNVATRNTIRFIESDFMPSDADEQTQLLVGVDVGGTFTDLVAFDGATLRIVKIPSSPPEFHKAVVEAVARISPS